MFFLLAGLALAASVCGISLSRATPAPAETVPLWLPPLGLTCFHLSALSALLSFPVGNRGTSYTLLTINITVITLFRNPSFYSRAWLGQQGEMIGDVMGEQTPAAGNGW